MKFNSVIIGGILISVLALLSSCATTTKLISSWKDDNYAGGHIKSIMIVGVSKDKNNRTLFERVFVEQFKRKGVEAVASIDILSKDEEPGKDAIKGAAEKLGIETVMVTHLVSVDKDVEVIPATYEYVPVHRYDQLGAYYTQTYARQVAPAYAIDITTVQLESNIYETKTEKLIWSAQSRTISEAFEGEAKYEIIKNVTKSLVKRLRKNGLLK